MKQISTWLDTFIASTAWPMTPPTAYGSFHLTFVAAGFTIALLLAWQLRTIGEKGNKRLLMGIGIFLLITEVYKQLFYFYYIGNETYQWWIFPFQLCSVPMYLCILAPLLKPGKVRTGMYNFMMIYNLLGGFMAFVEPSGLSHPYWTLTLHAFVWHMLLVFVGLYLAFSHRAGYTMRDYCWATATFLALCFIAFGINVLLWGVSGGTVNMFFVGPANSPLIVFETIAKRFGWYVSTILYIPVVCIGAFLFFLPFHIVGKRGRHTG